jgi:dTDP-4-dehydrorhamnose reductase
MHILVLGAAGQVGRALLDARPSHLTATGWDRDEADLEDGESLIKKLDSAMPGCVINAAAYTAVDRAESDEPRARAINAVAVGRIAEWCRANGALLAHYSTDYVFDGSGSAPWREGDPTGPLSAYGRGKLEGERLALASGASCLIVRTSWVFAAEGSNFVRAMLRLGREREELAIVDDQWGAPTLALDLAQGTWRAVQKFLSASESERRELSGLYHLCGSGPATTWKGFAQAIFARAERRKWPLKLQAVRSVSTKEYGAAAPRPLNSRLECKKFAQTFDFTMPSWENALERTLEEIDARHLF